MTYLLLLAIIATSSSTFVSVTFDQSGLPSIDTVLDRAIIRPQKSPLVVHLGVVNDPRWA